MFQPNKSPTVMWIRAFIGLFWSVVEIRILPLDIQLLFFFHITGEIKASSTCVLKRIKVFSVLCNYTCPDRPNQVSVAKNQTRVFATEKDWGACTCSGRNTCSGAAVADDINTCICSYTHQYMVYYRAPQMTERFCLGPFDREKKEGGRGLEKSCHIPFQRADQQQRGFLVLQRTTIGRGTQKWLCGTPVPIW